jgi:hypothetical protein
MLYRETLNDEERSEAAANTRINRSAYKSLLELFSQLKK